MQIHLHQTHHKIGDFTQIFDYLQKTFASGQVPAGVHVFPELYLTGYPLQDLCLQKQFIDNYLKLIDDINQWSKSLKIQKEAFAILLGGLNYQFDEELLPLKIKNSLYLIEPGQELSVLYDKVLLPNYDIFDEKKYFTAGDEAYIWEWQNKNIALMICEDMWPSTKHLHNPTQMIADLNQPLDLIINISASPYTLGKPQARIKRAKEIAGFLNCPFVYVNRVGAEDEILFDGASFILNNEGILLQCQSFHSEAKIFTLPEKKRSKHIKETGKIANTWEGLFNVTYNYNENPPTIQQLTDGDCEELLQSISFGIQEYTQKTGFKKFIIGLSGGIDSALVLALCKMSLKEGQSLEAIYMPGLFSASISYDLSLDICKRMNIPFKTLPIKFFHSSIRNAYSDVFSEPLEGLADENIQSRLRGSLLYTRANAQNALVLNTSNKSELAVGYSTLYGDSIGAISPLGDLYKSEVFQLSRYINKKYGEVIPEGIITREPSAELRDNQTDSQSLPPYDVLDAILEGFLSYRFGKKDLQKLGFSVNEIDKVYGLYTKSEYKRSQFCPIIKLKAKSFGFGYRVPICKHIN